MQKQNEVFCRDFAGVLDAAAMTCQGARSALLGASHCDSLNVKQAKQYPGHFRFMPSAPDGSNLEHAGCRKVWQIQSRHQHPARVIPSCLLTDICGTCNSVSWLSIGFGRRAHPDNAAFLHVGCGAACSSHVFTALQPAPLNGHMLWISMLLRLGPWRSTTSHTAAFV